MKKICAIIGVVLLSLFFLCNSNAAIISFNPSTTPIVVNQNQSFQIEVFAQEDVSFGDLTSYGFYVDPQNSLSLVSFTGYAISNPDYDDLGLDNFINGFKNSTIPNAGGNVQLATLYFTAGSIIGTDTIQLEGLAEFFNGLAYQAQFVDILESINVNVNPVPIPGAAWLLGSGLIGLAGVRKRFFS